MKWNSRLVELCERQQAGMLRNACGLNISDDVHLHGLILSGCKKRQDMDLIANCLGTDFVIDHATCYGIQVHTQPTRSDSLLNNLHYKKTNKKNFKGYLQLCIASKGV